MITSTEAARALGSTRTEKKAASSRRNLAKARAKTAAALAAFEAACDKERAAAAAFHAVPAGQTNHTELVEWQKAANVAVETTKKLETIVPTLLVSKTGAK